MLYSIDGFFELVVKNQLMSDMFMFSGVTQYHFFDVCSNSSRAMVRSWIGMRRENRLVLAQLKKLAFSESRRVKVGRYVYVL